MVLLSIEDLPFSLQDGDLLNSLRITCNYFKDGHGYIVSEFEHLPPVLILHGQSKEYDLATDTLHEVSISIRSSV